MNHGSFGKKNFTYSERTVVLRTPAGHPADPGGALQPGSAACACGPVAVNPVTANSGHSSAGPFSTWMPRSLTLAHLLVATWGRKPVAQS